MDDRFETIAIAFVITMQTLFVMSFIAYSTSPMWMSLAVKAN